MNTANVDLAVALVAAIVLTVALVFVLVLGAAWAAHGLGNLLDHWARKQWVAEYAHRLLGRFPELGKVDARHTAEYAWAQCCHGKPCDQWPGAGQIEWQHQWINSDFSHIQGE